MRRIVSQSYRSSLTFVGLGPGDPNLLTIAAVDAINNANIIAYPVAYIGAKSIAKEIATSVIKNKKLLPILLPMVTDKVVLKRAWGNACNQLLEAADHWGKIVFICQGDPSLYATSSYLLYYIKNNYSKYNLKVIPGVTSFNAAAAVACMPLSLQKEDLLVLPTPDDPQKLNELLDEVIISKKVLVLIKLGVRWLWVREIIKKKNLLENTLFAQKVGFDDEIIVNAVNVQIEKASYFSLLIIRQSPNYIFS